jgi:hypothetical protein
LRCDESEGRPDKLFVRESPFVVVAEGFHDVRFICNLLRSLKIENCDVTYPKKIPDGGNGKDKIGAVLRGLAARASGLEGILIVQDADRDPAASFAEAQAAFKFDGAPFKPPSAAFAVQPGKIKTAVYLIPGPERTGTLEHLLFDAAADNNPDAAACIRELCLCSKLEQRNLNENDKAKLKLATMIATCCDDPITSLAWVWSKGGNPIPINSPHFKELAEFLAAFTSQEQATLVI